MSADTLPPSNDLATTPVLVEGAWTESCLADMERLLRLSDKWAGLDPTAIAERVMETLLDMLQLDFVGLRFNDGVHIFLRLSAAFGSQETEAAVLEAIENTLQREPDHAPIQQVIGQDAVRIVKRPLGALASLGTLVLGSRRANFPQRTEAVRLELAIAQAALACREVREISDREPPADTRKERPTGEALAASEWRLNLTINTIPAMAWSSTPDGMLDFCNRHLSDFVGLPAEEIMGLGFQRIFHPEDTPVLLSAWQEIMASKQGQEIDGRIRRADGEYRWSTFRQNPLLDAEGNVIKWYGVVLDIEDRKRAEAELKEAESALQASEQNLRLIIDSLPVLAWSARPDGSADFVNKSWTDYAGVPAQELLEWGFGRFYHPDDVDEMVEIWKRDIARGDETTLTGRIRRFDGEYRRFLFSGRKITDAKGVVRWFGVNVDIEDLRRAEDARKASETALRESERALNLIINTIPALAWSAMPDGMLDFWNQHFLDFVGLPFDEIKGTGFYRIFHPDDLELMRSAWEETLATKQPKEVDGRIRRADGEYRWFTLRQSPLLDGDGNVLKWYGVVVEIEDRKRAEIAVQETQTALLASESRLQKIITSIPGLVWAADANRAVTFLSRQYLDYTGLGNEPELWHGWTAHIHPDDRANLLEVWDRAGATGQADECEARLRSGDGEYRWFLFRASPFFDETGNIDEWFGVTIDIEDRKRAEEDLRQTQTDLAHASRMMTMGELAVSIAHEVNQPLMAVVTNASTCLRWLDPKQLNLDLARQAAERIVRDGHRAGDIVASIRALARKSAPKMEAVDLRRLIQEVLDLLRGEFQRRDIISKAEFSQRATTVLGDRTQLQQVVLNLVMNAIEAISPAETERRRLTVRTDLTGEVAQVSVSDTGVGLDPESRDRIFEAFYSTKAEGIGMGLAICRSIVEAHGGRIWASDNAPQGSVFNITLPLMDGVVANG